MIVTSGCLLADTSMAEWRMILNRLTVAGERSLSAIDFWGTPKICPLVERSTLRKKNCFFKVRQ